MMAIKNSSKLFYFTFVLAAFAVSSVSARADDGSNACANISFKYLEIIESQGIFGSKTPQADPSVVSIALNLNISNAWVMENATPSSGAPYFQLNSYCDLLSKAGIAAVGRPVQEITLVCHGDSSSGQIDVECMITRGLSSLTANDGYLALHRYAIASNLMVHNLADGEDRYALLAQPQIRSSLYAEIIRQMVNDQVDIVSRQGGMVNLLPIDSR